MDTWWVNSAELDEQQKDVIGLPLGGSFLVTGPPGSGKSNLLLLRANYLSKAGHPNLVVLVFNKTLQSFLASGAERYDFDPDKIVTFMKWSRQLLQQLGCAAPDGSGFDETRQLTAETVLKELSQRNLGPLVETALVDEAQDYLPAEIEILKRLSRNLFFAADARQKIYKGENPLTAIRSAVNNEKELSYHYRNGLKICRVADHIGEGIEDYASLEKHCNYDEHAYPSEVRRTQHPDRASEGQAIADALVRQLKAYPQSTFGVLCPRNDDMRTLWSELSLSSIAQECVLQQRDDGYVPFDGRRVCVCTVHGAKGLEFRGVHLAAADGLKRFPLPRTTAYVAATRAKTFLHVHHVDSLHGFLESALLADSPPAPLPPIEAAFGNEDE